MEIWEGLQTFYRRRKGITIKPNMNYRRPLEYMNQPRTRGKGHRSTSQWRPRLRSPEKYSRWRRASSRTPPRPRCAAGTTGGIPTSAAAIATTLSCTSCLTVAEDPPAVGCYRKPHVESETMHGDRRAAGLDRCEREWKRSPRLRA